MGVKEITSILSIDPGTTTGFVLLEKEAGLWHVRLSGETMWPDIKSLVDLLTTSLGLVLIERVKQLRPETMLDEAFWTTGAVLYQVQQNWIDVKFRSPTFLMKGYKLIASETWEEVAKTSPHVKDALAHALVYILTESL